MHISRLSYHSTSPFLLCAIRFTGECSHKDNRLTSCQELGNQFLIANQKFTVNYAEQCGNENPETDPLYNDRDVSQGPVEFACLGDWKVGKDHFFAVANTKESRKEAKYRCFLKNRDDDLLLGKSITPECNVLKTPQDSPERLNLTPGRSEVGGVGTFRKYGMERVRRQGRSRCLV